MNERVKNLTIIDIYTNTGKKRTIHAEVTIN